MLTSWRSEIRKAGISAVEALWGSNEEEYGTEEQHQEYAKGTLLGLKYLYKFPDVRVGDPTSARAGGCRSLQRCIAPLLPDSDKLWQRPGRTGRMIPTPRDLFEG